MLTAVYFKLGKKKKTCSTNAITYLPGLFSPITKTSPPANPHSHHSSLYFLAASHSSCPPSYSKPFLKLSVKASLTLFDETCLSYYAAQQAKSNISESFMQGIRGTSVCGWTGGLIYLFLPSPNCSCSGHWAKSDAGLLAHCERG